jgi:hypothetical protein
VQGCAGPVAHGAMPCVPSFLHCKRRCTRLLDPERLLTQTETNHSGTTEISQPIHPYRAPPTTEWMCGRTNSVARHAALMSVSPPPNRKCIAPIQSLPPSGRCSPGRAARSTCRQQSPRKRLGQRLAGRWRWGTDHLPAHHASNLLASRNPVTT